MNGGISICKRFVLVSAVLLPTLLASCGREMLENREGSVEIKRVDIVGLVVPDINAVDFNLIIEDADANPQEGVPQNGQSDSEIIIDEGLGTFDSEISDEGLSRNVVFDINAEMRGIWVATVKNIDYPSSATVDGNALRNEADRIIENCAAAGINNIFLQVRPCSDALYRSDIYPWSMYLTGMQGVAPSEGFDPLEYWTDGCHARGIALHAWVNPYRITKDGAGDYAGLSSSNPAVSHPEWVIKHKDNYYFDPGIPQVRELVTEGILEIVRNYDVDGIHFDDYFYPNESGEAFDDSSSYTAFGAGMNKADWRRQNVNELVSSLGPAIKAVNPDIVFGISPSGIWANNTVMSEGSRTSGLSAYSQLYADTRRWAREEWIDYIAPQLYWEIGYDKADYAVLVDWWAKQLEGVSTKLYIGIGDYRTVGKTKTAWAGDNGVAQIQQQMDMNDTYPNISGEIHYNYSSMMKNQNLLNYIQSVYNR